MLNFKIILFLLSLFLIFNFCFFEGVIFAGSKARKLERYSKGLEKAVDRMKKKKEKLKKPDRLKKKEEKEAEKEKEVEKEKEIEEEEKEVTIEEKEVKIEEKEVKVEEKEIEKEKKKWKKEAKRKSKKELEELKKKKKQERERAKEEQKIYAAVRKKVEQRRREAEIREAVKDVDVAKEVEIEVLKEKAWKALERSGAAVHMKEYVKLTKRSEDANDLAELSTMRVNVTERELEKIKQTKGESSDEAVKAQGHFDRLKEQANKANQESDRLKKDIDTIKETVLLIKLERDGQDSEMNLKDAVPGKTTEEQMEQAWKELEASGVIIEVKVKTQQEEIETVRKIEKEEEKIKKLKEKLAKIEKLPKEEQNPFGDVKQALKADIISARQKAASLKTGIIKGGEIGKLVSLEKKVNKLKGKPEKQKEYEETVRQKEELEGQLREKIIMAKGISLAEEPLLRAKLKSQISESDIGMLKDEQENPSTDLERKKEIETELAEINESKQFVENYINQKVSNETRKRARPLTDDEVAEIREELTKKAERLKEGDTLIDDAKKAITGEREEIKKEVKKMAMTSGMKFVGIFPSIFMTPPEVGAGEEGMEGEGEGLTEEQLEMLRKRRMAQAAG